MAPGRRDSCELGLLVVNVVKQLLRMMKSIGARPALIQMRRRNPLGITLGVLAGGPAAGSKHAMVRPTGEGQVVDVGGVTPGVVGDVVNLAVVAGNGAARGRAAAVVGVQHDSLSG